MNQAGNQTDMKPFRLKEQNLSWIEWGMIIGLAMVPLFVSMPYRVNIFLSWEGAYRLYLGQIPYRDFGMPLGYGFWVIPALFFRIFGPYLITLVKAQVFINILSGFAFRSILKSCEVPPAVRVLSVLVYIISFSFFNFWPWYDQSVIVYEILGLAFLFRYLLAKDKSKWIHMVLACFFLFFSFFTKQDAGGMALLIALALLGYNSLKTKKFRSLLFFLLTFGVIALAFILPLIPYRFGYWFNHGQPPHNARLDPLDLINAFLGGSGWLKFYLLMMILLALYQFRTRPDYFRDRKEVLFTLLTLGILVEAAIFQVTSYTPPDNNIFFQGFCFAYVFSQLEFISRIELSRPRYLILSVFLVMLWWSGTYWKYLDRIVARAFPVSGKINYHEVSQHTYMLPRKEDTLDTNPDMSDWVYSSLPVFRHIYMPKSTAEGIHRLMKLPLVRERGRELKVLNMSELTPLDYAIGYTPETGDDIPLWYHKGVAEFQPQIAAYEQKIRNHYYDLVLFEDIPRLNNFYPFEILDSLKVHYRQIDSFSGPRRAMFSQVTIFVKPDSSIIK